LLEAALALPRDERADLAEKLLASVDVQRPATTGSHPVIEDGADPDAETAWADEIVRRVERIERGEAKGTPVEEVRTRMLARFGHG
jgi:hypothetical protein